MRKLLQVLILIGLSLSSGMFLSGCSELSAPESTDASSTTDNATACEGCGGQSNLLGIIPSTTNIEVYPKQVVATVSGKCNDGKFPNNYMVWQILNSSDVPVMDSASANNYPGTPIVVDGSPVLGTFKCKSGRFLMDVQLPYTGGGLQGTSHTLKVFIYGLDDENRRYTSISGTNTKTFSLDERS